MSVVAPEHRPTLREELAPLPAPARWAVLGVLIVVGALIAVALLGGGSSADGRVITHRGPVTFNLRIPPGMTQLEPAAGEWVHLERKGQDSIVVSPLSLPEYKGDVGGILPVVASRELDALKKRFPDLEPVEEGKARINKAAGYSLSFRVSRSPRQYGRLVLLPQPVPGARDGVKLLLLATPAGGAGKATDVGTRGQLKTPYRSFRFGTEAP
ncbi:hypothetical protein [Solirubrobacter soli]|uniref:hypothetical protein n=1 Tax=Solirubrobacter soli TaxID=363832 RepID=UPI0004223A8C|nr:hypothetical protein [Solirubrobacter soli]